MAELGADTLAMLVEKARDEYPRLPGVQEESMPTIAALILFDLLRDDIKQSGAVVGVTRIRRTALRKQVENHPAWQGGIHKPSFNRIPEDIGKILRKNAFEVLSGGQTWILRFTGPVDRLRSDYNPDKLTRRLYLTVSYELKPRISLQVSNNTMKSQRHLRLPGFGGRCFFCPSTFVPQFDINARLCPNAACESNALPHAEEYVALFPEPLSSGDPTRASFPQLLRFVDDDENMPPRRSEGPPLEMNMYAPYNEDLLGAQGIDLGVPLVYRAPSLETWLRVGRVYVLDMSVYSISHTLKDPKSWAVMNAALELGVSTLAVHTAGNAGVSLAKLAYGVNRRMGSKINVYALLEERVPDSIRYALCGWGAKILKIEVDKDQPVRPRDLWLSVNDAVGRVSETPSADIWHVSEGWDGVGVLWYRALFAKLLAEIHADYVVAPVGQGNFFLGAFFGMRDAHSAHTHLIGAVPVGENIFDHCRLDDETAGKSTEDDDVALAPKLPGRFSPLARCIRHLRTHAQVSFIEVSGRMQDEGADHMRRRIAGEPSAAVAFGALHGDGKRVGLREKIREKVRNGMRTAAEGTILVVNSGFGLCDAVEAAFVARVHLGYQKNKQ